MKLGFVGTGNISSDVIKGIFKSKLSFKNYDIPENKSKALLLKENLKTKYI